MASPSALFQRGDFHLLSNVLNKIRATEAEISRLKRSVEDKTSLAYELTLSSLQSRLDELEMEFSEAANGGLRSRVQSVVDQFEF